MLRKLLKYDLKYIFKYWWILAVSALGFSIFGGICMNVMEAISESESVYGAESLVTIFAGLGIFLAILGLCAFLICSMIFVYTRLYKNFFTDEAYLTFTLPVKRHQLLTSKLLMSIITDCCTMLVFILGVFLFLSIGLGTEEMRVIYEAFAELFNIFFQFELGAYLFVYILEIIILCILVSICNTLVIFSCVTISAMTVKKHKVLAGIGIYYLVNMVISFTSQILLSPGLEGLTYSMTELSSQMSCFIVCLGFLVLIAFISAIAALLYTFVHWLLDKKLNLA